MDVSGLLLQISLGMYFLHVHCGVVHGALNPDRIYLKLPNEYIKKYMILFLYDSKAQAEMKKREFVIKQNERLIKKRDKLLAQKNMRGPKKKKKIHDVSFFETGFDNKPLPKKRKLLKIGFCSDDEFNYVEKLNSNLLEVEEKYNWDDYQLMLDKISLNKNHRSDRKKFKKLQSRLELKWKKEFFEDFISEKGISFFG
jgi:hypothetical protein